MKTFAPNQETEPLIYLAVTSRIDGAGGETCGGGSDREPEAPARGRQDSVNRGVFLEKVLERFSGRVVSNLSTGV